MFFVFKVMYNVRSKLYITNKKVLGLTAGILRKKVLREPFSQKPECTVEKTFLKNGTVVIKTLDNEKYSFFIKNPNEFLYIFGKMIIFNEKSER